MATYTYKDVANALADVDKQIKDFLASCVASAMKSVDTWQSAVEHDRYTIAFCTEQINFAKKIKKRYGDRDGYCAHEIKFNRQRRADAKQELKKDLEILAEAEARLARNIAEASEHGVDVSSITASPAVLAAM